LVFEVLCYANNLKPNYSDFSLDAIAVFIERSHPDDHQEFISVLAQVIFT